MLSSARQLKVVSAFGAILCAGLVTTAFMKAPPAPTASDIKAAKANAEALEIASKRTATYYQRLASGKMAAPTILFGTFHDDWRVVDKNKKGEGC